VATTGPIPMMDWYPGARENPPTRALEKPTRHKSWMTLLYPPGEGGRVVHFSVVGSLVGTA